MISPEARQKSEQRVKAETYKALRLGYERLFKTLRKERNNDWDEWQKVFLLALWMVIQEQANYFGSLIGIDGDAIYSRYALLAERRLRTSFEITRQHVLLELRRSGSSEEFLRKIEKWFSEKRAEKIGVTETSFLVSAALRTYGELNHKHRWRWKTQGDHLVCAALCLPREDRIFTMREPFPPSHSNCRCYPEWLD